MSTQTRESEVILKINSQQAQQKLKQLEDQAKSLRQEFSEAFKKGDTRGIAEVNKKLQKVNKEIANMRTNAANIRAAMTRLDEASPRELQRTLKLINNELNSGRVRRGSKEWGEYVGRLKEVQAELRKVKAEMSPDEEHTGLLGKVKDTVNGWGATAAAAMGAFAGVTMAGKAAVQAYADMEAEEANVRKFTGMAADEVARLNGEFKQMDTRTTREDLNKLGQEAGRLGKNSVDDVLGFVRAADQINVALDDLGEGATLTLSKLTGIFGDEKIYGTEQSLLKVGSVVNELSQNCSASAPYLTEFSSRIGGIAAQSKMTISQVMAFASVLDTQNLAVEASSTAVGQLITKIYQEPAAIAKAARLDVAEFSSMVKTDMNGALLMLFEHLNNFGGMENLASVFDEMGTDGARAIPVLTALAGHIDELKSQQEEASKAFKEGVSVSNEFAVQNNTVQAQLDKARKGFTEMAVELGEELLPVMRGCISGTSMLMRTMLILVNFIKEYRSSILLLSAAVATYTIAIRAEIFADKLKVFWTDKVTASTKRLWATLKAHPYGVVLGAVALLIGALTDLTRRHGQAAEAARKQAAEERRLAREASDFEAEAKKNAASELRRLKALYDAATDETKSKKERIKAAKQLIDLYPAQLKGLSAEAIAAGEAKTQYENLTTAILENARAKAAAQKILENESKLIDLQLELDDEREKFENDSIKLRSIKTENARRKTTTSNSASTLTGALAMNQGVQLPSHQDLIPTKELEDSLSASSKKMDELGSSIDRLNSNSAKITSEFKNNKTFNDQLNGAAGNPAVTPITLGETKKEREAREKAEREAATKAKEALKKDLDDAKAIRDTAEAQNIARYATGIADYREFTEKKREIEEKYADSVVKIHENHDKIDIAAYGAALKSRMELQKKHEDEQRKLSLSALDRRHGEHTDGIVTDYYDPSSAIFQNERAMKQRLLQEDLRYLEEKKKIYAAGSREAVDIQREIDERLAADKLEKQKETAEAYAAFERQYRDASGSTREQMETAILDDLHDKGLISEEEYQRALRDIKEKYRKEDEDKRRTIQSETFDMVRDLYTSFHDLFSNLGKEGSDFWGDLSKAGEAAFAVMGAMLSQYSAYTDAERDLELAKIQQRYDREIEAAGNNEKKKAALEKQRDEELAKTKSKYNEKAMKIEIAQALAQTAMNAIAAYGAGLQVGGMAGLILAPIAAAMATAAGMMQIATIKKQHEAQAAGYYSGGFTDRDPDNRREVGVVHANEFVANHQAVANPALSPVLSLIDRAQRNNTIGSLTAADVSNALGQGRGVSARGEIFTPAKPDPALAGAAALMADTSAATRRAIDRLSDNLEGGIETYVVMDGERGLHRKLKHYERLTENPKR